MVYAISKFLCVNGSKVKKKMPEVVQAGTSPQLQSALLRSVLKISPQKGRSGGYSSTPVSAKKTDLLMAAIGKTEIKSEMHDHTDTDVSPLRLSSQSNKRKVQSSGKKISSHFAGSAFQSSPHPDCVPMPDFDENFFN